MKPGRGNANAVASSVLVRDAAKDSLTTRGQATTICLTTPPTPLGNDAHQGGYFFLAAATLAATGGSPA